MAEPAFPFQFISTSAAAVLIADAAASKCAVALEAMDAASLAN